MHFLSKSDAFDSKEAIISRQQYHKQSLDLNRRVASETEVFLVERCAI